MRRVILTAFIALTTLGAVFTPVTVSVDVDHPTITVETQIAAAQEDDTPPKSNEKPRGDKSIPCGNLITDFGCYIAWIINTAFIGVPSLLLWIAGGFLTLIIDVSVINFAGWVENVSAINIAWKLLRDVANMLFIFVLLYISISTILQQEGYGARRLLGKVVIVALLLNFSLFFTRAAIDASNIVANEFHQGILALSEKGTGEADAGVSALVMSRLKLTTIYKVNEAGVQSDELNKQKLGFFDIILVSVMGSIFILTTAFVIFAAGILLAIRMVVLIILMALSPLAFAAMILPRTNGIWKDWFNKLIDNLIFAPLYMAMLFVTLLIVSDKGFLDVGSSPESGASFFETLTSGSGNLGQAFGIVLNFVLVIGFMVSAIIISKKFGASGANTVAKWGHNFRGSVGRNTLGWAGNRLAQSEAIKGRLTSDRFFGLERAGARLALRSSEKLESASFGGAKGGYKKAAKDAGKEEKRLIELQAETGITNEARRARTESIKEAKSEVKQAQRALKQASKDAKLAAEGGGFGEYAAKDKEIAAQKKLDDAKGKLTDAKAIDVRGNTPDLAAAVATTDAAIGAAARKLNVEEVQVADQLYEVSKDLKEKQKERKNITDPEKQRKKDKEIVELLKKQNGLMDKANKNQKEYAEARQKHDKAVEDRGKAEKATKRLITEQRIGDYSFIPQLADAQRSAVKEIRKELGKSKDKKLLDDIKALASDDSPSAPAAPAPEPAADDGGDAAAAA